MPVNRHPKEIGSLAVLVALTLVAAGTAHAGPSPFGVATPDSAGGAVGTGPFSGILLWAIHLQTRFYTGLTDALSRMTSGGHAAQWLIGLSLLYGVFHAVGPGHGKAVVSAYLFATGDTLRRGVALSFAAAFVQALSALAIVSVAAIIFQVTAVTMTHVTDMVEIGSYTSITLVGLALLTSRIRLALAGPRPALTTSRFVCEELPAGCIEMPAANSDATGQIASVSEPIVHGRNCGCADAIRLAERQPAQSWAGYVPAVVSVGIRPCSGALIVLVFALSQGLFPAGVLSVFAMAIGTGSTVALVAILSVTARDLMVRSVSGNDARVAALSAGLQILAATLFMLFGLAMTVGALVANGLI